MMGMLRNSERCGSLGSHEKPSTPIDQTRSGATNGAHHTSQRDTKETVVIAVEHGKVVIRRG